MTPAAAGALLQMQHVTSREDAEMWADIAQTRGATAAECVLALREWEEARAGEVVVLNPQPSPPPTCRCSHTTALHTHGSGQCWNRACGCRHFRAKPGPGRTDGGPSVTEYLRSKGEL